MSHFSLISNTLLVLVSVLQDCIGSDKIENAQLGDHVPEFQCQIHTFFGSFLSTQAETGISLLQSHTTILIYLV
jgi:hypothetical protein